MSGASSLFPGFRAEAVRGERETIFCRIGGIVTSTMTGNITTLNDGSTGFLAQSVGGGGGNGGMNVSAAISAAGVS